MENLIQLMSQSESVIDLEERLKKAGREFPTIRKYVSWLNSEWTKAIPNTNQPPIKVGGDDAEFPTLQVDSNGITYLLHGLVHGAHVFLAPGLEARKNVRDYIRGKADSFHRPHFGEDYLCEENFAEYFNLRESHELKDHSAGREKPSRLAVALSVPMAMLGTLVISSAFNLAYLYSKTCAKPNGVFSLTQEALSDEQGQARFAKIDIAKQMPQPFELEKRYLEEKGLRLGGLYSSAETNCTTAGERSLWIAGQLEDFAKSNGLTRMHFIGGLGHATEIAYFLTNPGYSFRRLEEYRQKKKG